MGARGVLWLDANINSFSSCPVQTVQGSAVSEAQRIPEQPKSSLESGKSRAGASAKTVCRRVGEPSSSFRILSIHEVRQLEVRWVGVRWRDGSGAKIMKNAALDWSDLSEPLLSYPRRPTGLDIAIGRRLPDDTLDSPASRGCRTDRVRQRICAQTSPLLQHIRFEYKRLVSSRCVSATI